VYLTQTPGPFEAAGQPNATLRRTAFQRDLTGALRLCANGLSSLWCQKNVRENNVPPVDLNLLGKYRGASQHFRIPRNCLAIELYRGTSLFERLAAFGSRDMREV
jgi:hypothetical protein